MEKGDRAAVDEDIIPCTAQNLMCLMREAIFDGRVDAGVGLQADDHHRVLLLFRQMLEEACSDEGTVALPVKHQLIGLRRECRVNGKGL